jgi:hypothetical protein
MADPPAIKQHKKQLTDKILGFLPFSTDLQNIIFAYTFNIQLHSYKFLYKYDPPGCIPYPMDFYIYHTPDIIDDTLVYIIYFCEKINDAFNSQKLYPEFTWEKISTFDINKVSARILNEIIKEQRFLHYQSAEVQTSNSIPVRYVFSPKNKNLYMVCLSHQNLKMDCISYSSPTIKVLYETPNFCCREDMYDQFPIMSRQIEIHGDEFDKYDVRPGLCKHSEN